MKTVEKLENFKKAFNMLMADDNVSRINLSKESFKNFTVKELIEKIKSSLNKVKLDIVVLDYSNSSVTMYKNQEIDLNFFTNEVEAVEYFIFETEGFESEHCYYMMRKEIEIYEYGG